MRKIPLQLQLDFKKQTQIWMDNESWTGPTFGHPGNVPKLDVWCPAYLQIIHLWQHALIQGAQTKCVLGKQPHFKFSLDCYRVLVKLSPPHSSALTSWQSLNISTQRRLKLPWSQRRLKLSQTGGKLPIPIYLLKIAQAQDMAHNCKQIFILTLLTSLATYNAHNLHIRS